MRSKKQSRSSGCKIF